MESILGLSDTQLDNHLSKREFNTEKRKKLADTGAALPDGSYPIVNRNDLKNAIRAYGRSNPSDREKVKRHIKRRAEMLGATRELPENW